MGNVHLFISFNKGAVQIVLDLIDLKYTNQ